jgi:hypothetical protein
MVIVELDEPRLILVVVVVVVVVGACLFLFPCCRRKLSVISMMI